MALKKVSMAETIMGGVRKNIEISNDSITNGTQEELVSAPVVVAQKKVGKEKDPDRIIRKWVFVTPELNRKLEDLKQWRRYKEGNKYISVDDLINEIVIEWMNNNYEQLKEKYEG